MNFTGMAGATALSAIAFGVVFLVLIGLTFVIYAMRIVTARISSAFAFAASTMRFASASAFSTPSRLIFSSRLCMSSIFPVLPSYAPAQRQELMNAHVFRTASIMSGASKSSSVTHPS